MWILTIGFKESFVTLRIQNWKQTITVVNTEYCTDLLQKLQAIVEEHRGNVSRREQIFHNDTPVNTVAMTRAAIREYGVLS